jgi:hypothetical protein
MSPRRKQGSRYLVASIVLSFLFIIPKGALSALGSNEINQLLLCYKSHLKTLNGRSKYELAFHGLPENQVYKMFIDKNRLIAPDEDEENVPPHLLFDVKEPGYFKAMTDAFDFMSTQIGSKNDLDLIIQLHDYAVNHVKSKDETMKKGLESDWQYPAPPNSENSKGFEELAVTQVLLIKELIVKNLRPEFPNACSPDAFAISLLNPFYLAEYQEHNKKIVSNSTGIIKKTQKSIRPYLDHYQSQILKTKTLYGKLMAMSELLRTLEVYHIFPDGNQRTYAFLMLNKLLIENNIPPAILDEPDMFDGHYSVQELSERLLSGIKNYLNETEIAQKAFIKSSCERFKLEQNEPHYLNKSGQDYYPYFKVAEKEEKIEDRLKLALRSQVEKYIKKGKLKETLNNPDKNYGLNFLSQAILYHDRELIKKIIDNDISPLSDSDYGTPLTVALHVGDKELIRELLRANKERDVGLERLRTAIAVIIQKPELNEFLGSLLDLLKKGELSHHKEITQGYFADAVAQSNSEAIQLLLDFGAKPDKSQVRPVKLLLKEAQSH